ncbi:MAG TPA: TIGR03435 family protein [Acidobacteriaceae bacterium]
MRKRTRYSLFIALFFAVLVAGSARSQTGIAAAQDADAASAAVPRFDVISVKPDKNANAISRARVDADGLAAENVTVHMLLMESYLLNEDQLLGEPAWAKTDRFDIQAKVAGSDVAKLAKLSTKDRRSMFRQVLVEQFQLTTHVETRQLPVYVVTVAKGGPKFKPHVPDPAHPERENGSGWFSWGRGKLVAQGPTMAYFLFALSLELRHTFVDKTGLAGNYDFNLEWTPDDLAAPAQGNNDGAQPVAGDSGPSIFTAIQEQLGLKLASTKGPVRVMVVDNVTRPTGD